MDGRVVLRAVTPDDLPAFFEQQLDPVACEMAAFPARDREAFMAHWGRVLDDRSAITRAILLDGRVAGNVGCWEALGERLVGYWIGREFWGKGVATSALRAFVEEIGLRPLHARVARTNGASIRVLEKCGFVVCGAEKGTVRGVEIEELVYVMQ